MASLSWWHYALIIFAIIGVIVNYIVIGMYVGNKNNLDQLQKGLGIATAVLFVTLLFLYGTIYTWIQADSSIFIPSVLVLSFMNSLISNVGLTAAVIAKQ